MKWTRLSCCSFAANTVRLQLHALAYNLGNFMAEVAVPSQLFEEMLRLIEGLRQRPAPA